MKINGCSNYDSPAVTTNFLVRISWDMQWQCGVAASVASGNGGKVSNGNGNGNEERSETKRSIGYSARVNSAAGLY
jgi:hypothetical protein